MRPRYNSRMSRAARRPFLTVAVVLGLFVAVLGIGALATGYFDKEQVTFTLNEKESVTVNDGNGGSQNEYRLYTDRGTFVVKDSLVYLRFNSADVYGKLKEGTRYNCTAYGFRLPFFSKFKNILECQETTR